MVEHKLGKMDKMNKMDMMDMMGKKELNEKRNNKKVSNQISSNTV